MDAATGKLLNTFQGHKVAEYRCRSCFGHAEASVICGDEDGKIWAWDLLDVSSLCCSFLFSVYVIRLHYSLLRRPPCHRILRREPTIRSYFGWSTIPPKMER